MADEISREEKLAAGLKKLKQFQQQRSSKSKTARRKSPLQNDSPEAGNSSLSTPRKLSADSSIEKVPLCKTTSTDFEQTKNKELSSTESLRQISLQVNGLMSETDAFVNGDISREESPNIESQSLEKRNQELALLVNNLRQSNDQLQFQLQEFKVKNKRLTQSFEQEKQEVLEKAHKEQVSLKDQLNVHIQTIGILVAEKTELQSTLSLNQQTSKQKAGEVEELFGRLRASRQRASDLERELAAVNSSYQQLDKINKESSKEVDRLKSEIYKYSRSNEDLSSANSELKEKLNKKIQDLQSLEKELTGCRSKLSAAESHSQQLPDSNTPENRNQLEELFQEKINLEKKVSLLKASVDKLMNERDSMADQYQQYVLQLSEKVASLQDELKQLRNEKEELSKERNLLQESLETHKAQSGALSKEDPAELKLQITVLKNHNEELNKKWQIEVATNSSLCDQIRGLEEKVVELEKILARMKDDQVDQNRLVETMQSDKVAASRAVTQNRELKKQLEELQNGFVEMSNDKLELTERLDSEKHRTKELGERLSQQEDELRELQEQLAQKESELQNLHKSNTKGIFQQNQIADRMRHYEAQGHLAEMLQSEIHQAQEQINALTSQNSDLRMALAKQAEITVDDENQREDKDSSKRNDLVASLSASVRQLEMERNQMMKQLEEQKVSRLQLEEEMKKQETLFHEDGTESNVVSRKDYEMMRSAMTQLEERFKQTMSKIAELSDERQQLEHLVLQLQGETDTIGDYIALYQIQRGLMRKRASEKDDYIAQLARDREDLKAKLGELQNLVMRLLEERKHLQSNPHLLNDNLGFINMPHISDSHEALLHDSHDHICEKHLNGDIEDDDSSDSDTSKPDATAKKIIKLLSDIETTNLVEKPVLDSFHPCPVCSGRLITV
ncbi:golgin subfamily A member 2 isoform X2 [Parasteatoda tepidariorum]|uniref:golgin subfamily A member 2 isoform X2 n=1 Tax=Parasteatoda tepidariorum TaxID=114398 RepID=UPI001C71A402|nr:golgin subfamily A member 2 isoform X2 [Parasteatoda tepidariorum]